MLEILRKILPEFLKKPLRNIREDIYDPWQKRKLHQYMKKKHEIYVSEISKKQRVRVVFLVYIESIWKLDTLFQKMLKDPYFDPVILVCPCTTLVEAEMWQNMDKIEQLFSMKGYPVVASYDAKINKWRKLSELGTDIVFFTLPGPTTLDEYYIEAYMNYLSCFCGYGYIITLYNKGIPNFDQYFHSALWRNYITDTDAEDGFKKYSSIDGVNGILTGFPNIERLLNTRNSDQSWKFDDSRIKIIFAPHHSIEIVNGFSLSNFLRFADLFKRLVKKYQNQIVWCFKPHPSLKTTLYQHPFWGKEKTEKYYQFWKEQENTQYLDGDYIDLFKNSDAMIHDSGSFLIEYLTQKKPVLYLVSENTTNTMSELAKKALKSCQQASDEKAIEEFILKLLRYENGITKEHEQFYEEEFVALYSTDQPSDRIIRDIKSKIFNGRESS